MIKLFLWTFDILTETSLTHFDNVPNSGFEINIIKPTLHEEKAVIFISLFMSCAPNIVFNSTFVLYIVNSLVIIHHSLVEKTSQMSLTP